MQTVLALDCDATENTAYTDYSCTLGLDMAGSIDAKKNINIRFDVSKSKGQNPVFYPTLQDVDGAAPVLFYKDEKFSIAQQDTYSYDQTIYFKIPLPPGASYDSILYLKFTKQSSDQFLDHKDIQWKDSGFVMKSPLRTAGKVQVFIGVKVKSDANTLLITRDFSLTLQGSRGGSVLVWILIGVLILLLLGAGAFFFMRRQHFKDEAENALMEREGELMKVNHDSTDL
jgi:hypothetical protein